MVENNIRVRLWARRKWWVDGFLMGFLPIAHAMKFFGGERGADAAISFVGHVIGRYGMRYGVD